MMNLDTNLEHKNHTVVIIIGPQITLRVSQKEGTGITKISICKIKSHYLLKRNTALHDIML